MKVPREPATFRCKVCNLEFTVDQDTPFLNYLAKGTEVPMKCPHCRTDRISEFLNRGK